MSDYLRSTYDALLPFVATEKRQNVSEKINYILDICAQLRRSLENFICCGSCPPPIARLNDQLKGDQKLLDDMTAALGERLICSTEVKKLRIVYDGGPYQQRRADMREASSGLRPPNSTPPIMSHKK